MSEQGHTPGPLEIVEAKTLDSSGQWHIYLAAPDGRKIAALWGSQSEKIGNARLYRAAPDMLAALYAARATDSYANPDCGLRKLVDAAIAKATEGLNR